MEIPTLPFLDHRPEGATAVKICGFIEPEGFHAAHEIGVDAVGLNFWPGSKRFIAPSVAGEWVAVLSTRGTKHQEVLRVGVFVNPSDEEVLGPWQEGIIHAAQLHGDEPPDQCARLMAAGVPIIKAFGWRGDDSLAQALRCRTPYILADAFAPGVYGGTGHALDWDSLRSAWGAAPEGARLILSGGLNPTNAAAAVEAVQPAMIDVASGVEFSPGVKNPALIRALMAAVR